MVAFIDMGMNELLKRQNNFDGVSVCCLIINSGHTIGMIAIPVSFRSIPPIEHVFNR